MNNLQQSKIFKLPIFSNWTVLVWIIGIVMILCVLQDYLFSNIRNTGFYLSESFLYNTIWLYWLPLIYLMRLSLKYFHPRQLGYRILYYLFLIVIGSFVHTVLFTCSFVGISRLMFSPPHHLQGIYNSVLSNQLYIIVFAHLVVILHFNLSVQKNGNASDDAHKLLFAKIGSRRIGIEQMSIRLISTDKPYAIIHTQEKKHLILKSLNSLERELDPVYFIRVHRSAIINSFHINDVVSRMNGDYDVSLDTGVIVRFSRHYRDNWKHLLH